MVFLVAFLYFSLIFIFINIYIYVWDIIGLAMWPRVFSTVKNCDYPAVYICHNKPISAPHPLCKRQPKLFQYVGNIFTLTYCKRIKLRFAKKISPISIYYTPISEYRSKLLNIYVNDSLNIVTIIIAMNHASLPWMNIAFWKFIINLFS